MRQPSSTVPTSAASHSSTAQSAEVQSAENGAIIEGGGDITATVGTAALQQPAPPQRAIVEIGIGRLRLLDHSPLLRPSFDTAQVSNKEKNCKKLCAADQNRTGVRILSK